MTRHNLTATISSSVTENAVCWLRWPQDAQQPCPETEGLLAGGCAAGDSTRVRFYTLPTHLSALSVGIVGIQVQECLNCVAASLNYLAVKRRVNHRTRGWRFQIPYLMIPSVAGVESDYRPLGYEGNSARYTNQSQPTKSNETLRNPARSVGSLWTVLAAVHGQKTDSAACRHFPLARMGELADGLLGSDSHELVALAGIRQEREIHTHATPAAR
jgi:hypothetical protein